MHWNVYSKKGLWAINIMQAYEREREVYCTCEHMCTCVHNLHMCAHMSVHSVGNCAGSPACSYGGWRKPPYAPIFLWRRPPTASVGGGILSFLKVSSNIYLSSAYMLIRQYWERKSVQNALIISSVSCFILHLTRRFPIPSNPIHFVAYAATSVFDSVF